MLAEEGGRTGNATESRAVAAGEITAPSLVARDVHKLCITPSDAHVSERASECGARSVWESCGTMIARLDRQVGGNDDEESRVKIHPNDCPGLPERSGAEISRRARANSTNGRASVQLTRTKRVFTLRSLLLGEGNLLGAGGRGRGRRVREQSADSRPRDEMRATARTECMTRRRGSGGGGPRGPLSGLSTHLRRRYTSNYLFPRAPSGWPSPSLLPPSRSRSRSRFPPCLAHTPALSHGWSSSLRLLSRPLPPSKSPLFIANGFRIMMPWVAPRPYSNTSCFLVRANLVPSPPTSSRARARTLFRPSRCRCAGLLLPAA